MSITQAQRLSYSRRDLISFHDDISRLLKYFIPRVTDTSEMNEGRLYLTLIEALVDNLNYSVDQMALESLLRKARQRKNLLEMAYFLTYAPSPVSSASIDLTFTMLSGVAGAGGYAIPIYTRIQTIISPIYEFITMASGTILEGTSSIVVPATQGIRVIGESLSAAASGIPNQKYKLASPKTPHMYIEVSVNAVLWTNVDDFSDSDEETTDYILQFDEDDYTYVIFGDGEHGKCPPVGSSITVTYIRTLAEQGNAASGAIGKVIGVIASDVGVSSTYGASGGAASETNDSIKLNAPAYHRTIERAVTRADYEAIGTAYPGVYRAFANPSEGSRTDIYILPDGGGVASSLLLSQVQAEIDAKAMEGALPLLFSLAPAYVLIYINIVTKTNRIQKSTVGAKIRQATLDNLDYRLLTKGRGFTISDLAGVYEALDNGTLIDYVDFSVLSRVPRVQQSNLVGPSIIGRVNITSTAGYDEYLLTALSATTFCVAKNSLPQALSGTVGVEFVMDNDEVYFTLGEVGDVLVVGDTWRWTTSKYADNIVIDAEEYMALEFSSDLVINVYYPNEYSVKTKSAI